MNHYNFNSIQKSQNKQLSDIILSHDYVARNKTYDVHNKTLTDHLATNITNQSSVQICAYNRPTKFDSQKTALATRKINGPHQFSVQLCGYLRL
ncbi:unnamed protein product, partial [Rotaria magnacalcarata]